jgi:hypothetical protein
MRNFTGEYVKSNLIRSYELQKKRKLRSINAWCRSEFSNRSSINNSKSNQMYKLTYVIGLTTIQEWRFHSKNLAHWKRMDLIETGRFNNGTFKIEQL